jgi:hypothetical protein
MADERSFMQVLREQVVAQANLLEALTAHPTLVGAGRERAVIDMLRGQIPRRYEVLTGTVLGQDDEGSWQKENRQLDVMVVDTFDYPTLLRNGDIAVVLPQAVRVVIEVKSDLCAPPDPDKAPIAKESGQTDGDDDDLFDEDNTAEKKSKYTKPKETFLHAIKQVSRNRLLFGELPILTVLLSHKYPAGNDTLRAWLDLVLRSRRKMREQVDGLKKDSKSYSSLEQEAHALEASFLPDVIIADRGAIATRDGSKYNFFIAGYGEGKKATAPGLVTLVSYVVEHLDRRDPVLQMMRHDSKYESLRTLRQDAHKLFREVTAPGLQPDDKNLPLELGELPSEADKKGSYLDQLLNEDDSVEILEPRQEAAEDNRPSGLPESSPKEGV